MSDGLNINIKTLQETVETLSRYERGGGSVLRTGFEIIPEHWRDKDGADLFRAMGSVKAAYEKDLELVQQMKQRFEKRWEILKNEYFN